MKHITILLLCVAITLVSCTLEDDNLIQQQFSSEGRIDKAYNYDAFTSRDVWSSLGSFDERMAACQVPETVASQLTTEALIQTCLNHPFAPLYKAYASEFEMVRLLTSQNHAFKELLNRRDAGEKLIIFYLDNPDLSISKMHFLELLLGSGLFPSVYEEPLSSQLKVAAEGYLSFRRMMPEKFSVHSRKTAEMIVREIEGHRKVTMETANRLLMEIEREAVQILTKSAGDYTGSVNVCTPLGTSFTGYCYEDYSDDERNDADDYFQSAFPNAYLMEPSSCSYNAHSYAWNMANAGPTCWVTSTGKQKYIDDWSYVAVNTYMNADVITMSGSDFSGIPTSTSGVVVSKWENGPVMRHSLNESPFGTISSPQYYRLNQNGQYSSWPGYIAGEDMAYCYMPTPYSFNYTFVYSFPATTGGSFSWEVLDIHDNPANCTITGTANSASIVFNAPGTFVVKGKYSVNGSCITSKEKEVIVTVWDHNYAVDPDEPEEQ